MITFKTGKNYSTHFFSSLLLLLFSGVVNAEAGRVIFAYGDVTAVGTNGVVRVLTKRDQVETGEIIRTSSQSLVQMRMIDKAFIALRSNSEIKIEEYKLGVDKEEDSGIFSLIRGGFRAVTGIIGKRLRSAYKMKTLTATIGIRGTDYTARLCNQDCNQAFGNLNSTSSIADGLYVGVNEGGVNLTNKLGTLDLEELQFGYVKDATSAPVALLTTPEFLYFNSRQPSVEEDQTSADAELETEVVIVESKLASRSAIQPPDADLTSDDNIRQELQIEQDELSQNEIDQNTDESPIVEITEDGIPTITFASGQTVTDSINQVSSSFAGNSNVLINSNATIPSHELSSFESLSSTGQPGTFSQGTSESIDLGYDPDTGIAWGRWSGGVSTFTESNSTASNVDLSTSSLHWISSPEQGTVIALPKTGTVNYQWVGNTPPTSSAGLTGVLGNASMTVNFNNLKVNTEVAVGFSDLATNTNQVWTGSAIDVPISSTNGGFADSFDSVTVNIPDATPISGAGETSGFFTNNAKGAGMSFSMEADINGTATTVNGTAAFQKQ